MSAPQSTATSTPPRPPVGKTGAVAVSPSRLVSTSGQLALPMRRWLVLVSERWLPQLLWSAHRTGRLGMSGLALLATALIFLLSTYLPLTREIEELRGQLQSARVDAVSAPAPASNSGALLLRSLPTRTQMPALLGVLLKQAAAARLTIDTGKYETAPLKSGGVTSYQVSFPITGSYPQVRQFIDATLVALPSVALSELSLTRKTIGDGSVEAQIRLTVFTRDAP
jgi:Tfp pilus assembly protein PilO